MGSSGELNTNQQKTTSPQGILNYLDDLCAYALSIGMTFEQFWYDDPSLIKYYIKAHDIKRALKNQELWLQGLYVYQAIGNLIPVLNPFSKDHKAKPYLKEPIPLTQKEVEERRLKRIEKWTSMMMSRVKKS